MTMSEIVYCKICRKEFDATTEEVASYLCPNCPKPKPKLKIIDHVRKLNLTKVVESDETQSPSKQFNSTNDVKRKTYVTP
jgi:Zn finger protein HypA/HybF involved in hydrogenase expression